MLTAVGKANTNRSFPLFSRGLRSREELPTYSFAKLLSELVSAEKGSKSLISIAFCCKYDWSIVNALARSASSLSEGIGNSLCGAPEPDCHRDRKSVV